MGAGKYFTILAILFINFLVMITLAFRLKQHFILEFFLLVFFIIVSLIMLTGIYNDENWAYKLSSLFFIAFIVNIYFMYINATHGAIISSGAAFLAALGFLISIVSIKKKEDGYGEIEEPEKPVVPDATDEKVKPYGVKAEFKPGKFIASKTASNYHIPKCDWAKKIKKKNVVWFNSKQEAKKKGYKKHNCVK